MSAIVDSSRYGVGGERQGKVVLLYKQKTSPDAELALSLDSGLRSMGFEVFRDERDSVGLQWVRRLECGMEDADLVVVLLSQSSARSELLAYELEVAVQVAERQDGRPWILPVRVYYKGPLGDELSSIIHPLEFQWSEEEERHMSRLVMWRSPADDGMLAKVVSDTVKEVKSKSVNHRGAAKRPVPSLEPLGGAVPLDSKYYIERSTDLAFLGAVDRRDSLVLVKGARQMGKTSLLARGLAKARAAGCRVVSTDFQRLQASDFLSLAGFYRALSELVADQLDVELPETERWERNAAATFEAFWLSVLKRLEVPVLWGIDEFDRLFTSSFGSEVCGLFRSWHNARALDPSLPWSKLTIAIAYATEAQLFISDLNQSPFNVGTRLRLGDFSEAEVSELNERHGRPLAGAVELARLNCLLGGHPYLVRCAMNEMASGGGGVELVEELAGEEDSVFGEHLRRLLYAVGRDPVVTEALRGLIFRKEAPAKQVFYRMRSAGVVVGSDPESARMRCELYERYLRRHLAV